MAGFTETEFTSFTGHFTQTIAGATYSSGDYGSLQAALDALEATGGTLTLTQDYTVTARLHMEDASRFEIDAAGHTVTMGSTAGGATDAFELTRCKNFILRDFTIDGNKANRTSGVGMCFKLTECCSTFAGGGGATLIRCIALNAPEDGHRLVADISNPTNINRIPRNILYYQCEGRGCARLGAGLINGINIQVLGGEFSENGKDFGKAMPASGIDMEPNPLGTVVPGCSQFLYKGVTLAGNNRTGLVLSGTAEPANITITGCRFDGTSTDEEALPSGNTSHGSGMTIKCHDVDVIGNTFSNFGTHYDPVSAVVYMTSSTCTGVTFRDNLFLNCLQSDPVVFVFGTVGGGNAVINNRFSGNTGTNVQNNGGANCTASGNITSAIAPFPLPPVDVTFDEDGGGGFPGGGTVAFDAVTLNASENDLDWTHTPVGITKGVLVLIVSRGALGADEIDTVTYGSASLSRVPYTPNFATDVANEVGSATAFFKGSGLTAGPQTVTITKIGGASGLIRAASYTYTADGDTGIAAFGVQSGDEANPSITLTPAAGLSVSIAACMFGGATAAQTAVGSAYTEDAELETGAQRVMVFMHSTANSSVGDVVADWTTSVTDDCAAVAVAISNVSSVTPLSLYPATAGFDRTREFNTPSIAITLPPSLSKLIDGFERLREFGDAIIDIPNPIVVTLPQVASDQLRFPSTIHGGLAALLTRLRDNDVDIQEAYFSAVGTAGDDIIDNIQDVEIDESLQHAGGFLAVLMRLKNNDIVLNAAIGQSTEIIVIPDSVIDFPFQYTDGLYFILSSLQTNDNLLAAEVANI